MLEQFLPDVLSTGLGMTAIARSPSISRLYCIGGIGVLPKRVESYRMFIALIHPTDVTTRRSE